jgi:hypothetical protein
MLAQDTVRNKIFSQPGERVDINLAVSWLFRFNNQVKVTSPFEKAKGHGILGDTSFIDTILKSLNKPEPLREQPAVRLMIIRTKPDVILKAVADVFHVTAEDIVRKNYKGPARRVAMECLYRYAGMNQREIGDLMGVDYSSVSVARKRLHEALVKDRALKRVFEGLRVF